MTDSAEPSTNINRSRKVATEFRAPTAHNADPAYIPEGHCSNTGALPHRPQQSLYTPNVVSSGRHPKKPIADALAAVAGDNLRVDQIHKGHRWGVLVCVICGDDLSI